MLIQPKNLIRLKKNTEDKGGHTEKSRRRN